VIQIATVDQSTLSQLVGWQPPQGVVSIYLPIEHADRGQGWRTDLRDRLHELVEQAHSAGPRERWKALQKTSERIMERFPEGGAQPHARCLVLFSEVSEEPGFEFYAELQIQPPVSSLSHEPAPVLEPLVGLLDDGAAAGVVATASEEARVWHWYLGQAEQIAHWRFDRDLGPRSSGETKQATGSGQTVPRAGADQGGPHLEELRERFLRAVGEEVAKQAQSRRWRNLIAFGDEGQIRRLADDLQADAQFTHADSHNLAQAGDAEVATRVNELNEQLNRSRKLDLCERAKAAAQSKDGTGSLGLQETLDALSQARVAHLIYDRDRDYSSAPVSTQFDFVRSDGFSKLPLQEQMIEQALQTGASVTQLSADSAQPLAGHDGVAALLRF
jgi:Bacterial archaeo-eukaryotic release factor family 10